MARAPDDRTGSLGFEDKLWAAADVLRNNMDPAEYKHVVLGLSFLKYISDAFEERRAQLLVEDPEAVFQEPRCDALGRRLGESDAEPQSRSPHRS